jgi:hypothetical protein
VNKTRFTLAFIVFIGTCSLPVLRPLACPHSPGPRPDTGAVLDPARRVGGERRRTQPRLVGLLFGVSAAVPYNGGDSGRTGFLVPRRATSACEVSLRLLTTTHIFPIFGET